jgi:UDP-N-acetylenolpyruvoylglucosamine reductase
VTWSAGYKAVMERINSITAAKISVNPMSLPSLGMQFRNTISYFCGELFSHITIHTSNAQWEIDSQRWISGAQSDLENEAPGNAISAK